MALNIVATPIGNVGDITVRALEILKTCDALIGEETRVASTLLKKLGLEQKPIYELNEHTRPKDLAELVELCQTSQVALISDCGTPGFQDPGSSLIKICYEKKIKVFSAPGASSLMALISLAPWPIEEFYFRGFLPANNAERDMAVSALRSIQQPIVVMDTPYRLMKCAEEMAKAFPKHRALLGINLTQENEMIIEGPTTSLVGRLQNLNITNGEFVLLLKNS